MFSSTAIEPEAPSILVLALRLTPNIFLDIKICVDVTALRLVHRVGHFAMIGKNGYFFDHHVKKYAYI